MSVAVTIQGLEVRYGDNVALTGVDLELPAGSSLAVIGPNGSGKSTLLNAIAGINPPFAGTISWGGEAPALVLQSTEVDCSTSAGASPPQEIVPAKGGLIPAMAFRSVDFPEPFGPITASELPGGSSRSTPVKATVSP